MQTERDTGNGLANLAAAMVVLLFVVMVAGYFVPAYDGTDENGYLCAARRMALTGDSAKYTAHPLQHVSENVVQTGDTVFYPKYPLGYPWLCALAYRLGGPSAPFVVNPILAALAIVGTFFLARAMVGAFAGVLAAVLLATNPMHASFALSALSHSGAICFAVWAMYFLWCWVQRGGAGNAFAAGALAAYAYTVRYTEGLLVLPVVAMIVWRYFSLPEGATPTEHHRQARQWRREVAIMVAGAVLLALPLLVHHWIAFGRPWRTGYDLCGESTGFAWKWFQENWWLMLTRLNTPGLLLIFPLGLAGLAYLAAHDRKRGVFLGLWIIPAVLAYSAYYWAPQGDGRGYIRFFVSVFPPLLVCAMALLCEPMRPRPVWSVTLGLFIAVVATFNLREALPGLETQQQRLTQVRQMWDSVRQWIPEGGIIVASGGTLNDLEYAGQYELYSHDNFDRQTIKRRLNVLEDHDPHPFQRDKAQVLARAVGDMSDNQLAQMERGLLATNVAAGRAVAIVCPTDQFRSARGRLGDAFSYERATEWIQSTYPKTGPPRFATWAIYWLEPRRPQSGAPDSLATVDERIDRLQFHIRTLREEFEQRYPGARQKWDEINETERQLKDLRDKARQLAARKPAPKPATAGGTPAAPAVLPRP